MNATPDQFRQDLRAIADESNRNGTLLIARVFYDDETFHNQWQAYRTREEPALATQSEWHEYSGPGRYAIVVKIIDIFGNDTTKLAEVRIK